MTRSTDTKEKQAIVSSEPGVLIEPDVDLVEAEANTRASGGVYFLLVLLGLSSNLVNNALWVQLPFLISKLPEAHTLTLYFLLLWEFGNLSAVLYLFVKKCSTIGTSESAAIYIVVCFNTAAIALISCFWDAEVYFSGRSHSLVVIGVMLVVGQMVGLSSVTYIPYVATMKAGYITSVLLGDCLSALLPHAMAIAEGLSTPPDCQPEEKFNFNQTRPMYRQSRQHLSTTPTPPSAPVMRFPEYVYFYTFCGLGALGAFAFFLLRYIPSMRFEYERVHVECMDDGTDSRDIEDRSGTLNYHPPPTEGTTTVLDDGSIRQSFSPQGNVNIHPKTTNKVQIKKPLKHVTHAFSPHSSMDTVLPSFTLLMVITWWASFVTYGPLSSVKAHACLPVGNLAFFIGTLMTNAGAVITCLVVLKLSPNIRITLVVAFTCLATILLTYFVALIAFSHQSESREDSPIFGSFGELLATIGWSAIVGLFVFARASIAVICRASGKEYIVWYACVTQLGAAMGTLGVWMDISICQVYKSYEDTICTDI